MHELRRHPHPIRLTLLAAICRVRGREIADGLTDLLIATVHRIGSRAEKRVEDNLVAALKRVAGKPALLFKLAAASVARSDGAGRDVIFPAVGEQTLHDLVVEGEAAAADILRRFTRANTQHPTYRGLVELGKALRPAFVCRYLSSLELRREIHEGLNVVETWNSANEFIFFGRGGKIATNRVEDQEATVLSLHLLQNCLFTSTRS